MLTEYLSELIKNANPDTYRRTSIPLIATLTAAVTSGSDTYKVPSTHKLAIYGIRAHCAMLGLDTEAAGVGAIATLGVLERLIMKMMDARIQLQNQDLQQYILGENHPTNLASLSTMMGGKELIYGDAISNPPHIVLPGQTLRMDVTLVNVVAGVVGITTEFGVDLDCALIRTRGDI